MLKFFKTFCIFNMFHKKTLQKKRKKMPLCNFRACRYFRNQILTLHFRPRDWSSEKGECA